MPPRDCPPESTINNAIRSAEQAFRENKDSDVRLKIVGALQASIPTPCLTREQAQRILALAAQVREQAQQEEASFDVVGRLTTFGTRIAIGALGVILIVIGLIMIGGEATLNQAANRLGTAIRGAVR